MADKYADHPINPKAPWEDDIFKRRTHGLRISGLLQSFSKPHVVSVKADWGTGKTVFLKRLAAQLELDGIPTIVIDAWKTDYLEDPMLAFVSEINAKTASYLEKHKDLKRKDDLKKAGSALAKFGTRIVVPTIKVLSAVVPGAPEIAEAGAEAVRDIGSMLLELQEEQRDAQQKFRESLREIRNLLTGTEDGRMIRKSIVVIIDELDRCRPNYAIQALERIKHFFDVEGVMFVIATDKNNLPSAVRSVYGVEVQQAERYLRRFIDIEYSLPEPSSEAFVQSLADHFGLSLIADEVPIDAWRKAYKFVYQDPRIYASLIQANMRAVDVRECIEIFPRLAAGWSLSLRDQAQAFNLMSLILLSSRKTDVIFPQMLAYLCCLRFHAPDTYFDIVSGRASLATIVGVTRGRPDTPQNISWISDKDDMGCDLLVFKILVECDTDKINFRMSEGCHSNGNREYSAAFRRISCRTGDNAAAWVPRFAPEIATLMNSFAPNED